MLAMISKMTGVTVLFILLTVLLWLGRRKKPMTPLWIIALGVIFGGCSILSTHFGVNYGRMMLNVRDMGPLAAGLFFHPVSGVIAGLIGGIERYIAGTYWGVGSYTRVACSISTCIAGFFSVFLSVFILKRKRPSAVYALFMGAVMEVFHMYVILITHIQEMETAYSVVKDCALPMIAFTGVGLAACSVILQLIEGEWRNPFKKESYEEISIAERFQSRMFLVMMILILLNSAFIYYIRTRTALQEAQQIIDNKSASIRNVYSKIHSLQIDMNSVYYTGGGEGTFDIIKPNGVIQEGNHKNFTLKKGQAQKFAEYADGSFFTETVFNIESLCKTNNLVDGSLLLVLMPLDEVYGERDVNAFETVFADILLIAGVYILISFMVQHLVVDNLDRVNMTLDKITKGDLNQVVDVRNSSEFVSFSQSINKMVAALKGYIEAAGKRLEEELKLARTIQDSSLPKNNRFPRSDFEISMFIEPAREVGGDFYDFFFVGQDKLALVIADVSGKGIPASLFMMRSKTMIRAQAEDGKSPAEIFKNVNKMLSEGNDAEMFVSVWIGIIDLETGLMKCANAGHEYPALMEPDGIFELLKDKHTLVLAAMPEIDFKEYELQLHPGEKLFVYTDGVPEATDRDNNLYGTDRMLVCLNEHRDQPIDEILTALKQDIASFVGNADPFDDITMLGFTYNGPDRKTISMHIPAVVENLEKAMAFVDSNLEAVGCPMKAQMQLDVAVEELFVNIANYAYTPAVGDVKISFDYDEKQKIVTIGLEDSGKAFDPLKKADPDVTLSAEERQIGGLGIFMARKNVDEMTYVREDGKNILRMRKQLP